VDNFAKYTAPNTALDIRARTHDGILVVEFADQGEGLPKGMEERVFARHCRGSHSLTRGSGLGSLSLGLEEDFL
jgi:K+-sensing histidine kinase KdpD